MMEIDRKAQAELRRKRILANAEARLKKITGKEKVELPKVPADTVILHPANGHAHNGSCSANEPELFSSPPIETPDLSSPNEEEEINSRINELSFPGSINFTKKSEETLKKTHNPKAHWWFYLFFGVLIRILIYFGFSELFLNNIVGPFAVVCVPRLSWRLWTGEAPSPALSALASLAGQHQHKLHLILSLLVTSRLLLQYLALYLFSFILTDSLLEVRNL